MYSLLRRLLFCLPPETAHRFALKAIHFFYTSDRVAAVRHELPQKPLELFGLRFANRLGLAAGFDKDGECLDALFGLGFGFIEVGAVTPKPQSGNPKPRLFRLKQSEALINRFGFNNAGVDQMVSRLKARWGDGIVGVNIGKNATTPLSKAFEDYAYCYERLFPSVNFVTINLSSPNTPGLRELQDREYLRHLLVNLKELQKRLEQQLERQVPLLVKVAPDLTETEIADMAKIFVQCGIEGIVAVNTSLDRSMVAGQTDAAESGGLSGRPLLAKATRVVAAFRDRTEGQIPLIGVGGISSVEDAKQFIAAGASLVQLYTSLIYRGPGLVKQIVKNL